MDITQLASELHAWHVRNYPKETTSEALLAVGEEFGELERAELKQSGGIRGTWEEWQIEKQKEIGDIFIGLLEFAVRTKTVEKVREAWESHESLYPNRTDRWGHSVCYYVSDRSDYWQIFLATPDSAPVVAMPLDTPTNALLALKLMLGHISAAYVTRNMSPVKLDSSIYAFVYGLCEYAKLTNLDLAASLASRWQTISKRDFIANPLTGGRENEV